MTNKKNISFRLDLDLSELNRYAPQGYRSKFINEAIKKEIHRKKNTYESYILANELKDKENKHKLTITEIESTTKLIDGYTNHLKQLRRKEKKELEEIKKMKKELEQLKTTEKQAKTTEKERKQVITENEDLFKSFAKRILKMMFYNNKIPDINKMLASNYNAPIKKAYGTANNFIDKYFYNYIENHVLTDKRYQYDTNKELTPTQRELLKDIVKNKNLFDVFDVVNF